MKNRVARIGIVSPENGHTGIVNIMERAKQYPLTQFYTCHCTGTEAFDFLAQQMPNMSYLSCGETVEL